MAKIRSYTDEQSLKVVEFYQKFGKWPTNAPLKLKVLAEKMLSGMPKEEG